jgi:nucleotide-binding universal stress UspA family protein
MFPIQTILHPTDFSQRADCAFELACMLARDYAARLVVVHVLEPPLTVMGGTQGLPPLPEERGREEAEERLRRLTPPDARIRIERLMREGDVAGQILRVAEEIPCDVIVMGTHGRTGLSRLLMGSVAERVVRKSHCPVVTLKTPLHKPSLAARAEMKKTGRV